MRKAYLIAIVIVIAAVIVAGALAVLALSPPARAGGGVELASSSYTVEVGLEKTTMEAGTVTENGITMTGYIEGWNPTTYVNVTVTLFNTADETKIVNLSASVYDGLDGRSYRNTDYTKLYSGDLNLYNYSVEPGKSRVVVLTIEVPKDLTVTDDMVRIFFDGGVYRDGEKII